MESSAVTTLTGLFESYYGKRPSTVTELKAAGSSRKYYRLGSLDTESVIGTVGSDVAENEAFIYLSHHFTDKGLPVPEVLAVSADRSAYLQTDLGDISLMQMIESDDYSMVEPTLRELPRLQFEGAQGLDFSRCYPVSEMNRRCVMWDLNYFKYSFLKVAGVEFDEDLLEDDFERFTDRVLDMSMSSGAFMIRDCQSRNVMIHDGEPWFIDYQGGRKGPALYDVASLLWQAKARFSDDRRMAFAELYRESASEWHDFGPTAAFHSRLRFMALFRSLQVLGAYGFRGLVQNKVHFIVSIPPAIANLKSLLPELRDEYPELLKALERLVGLTEFADEVPTSGLKVTVNSFGFRKSGIPRDMTGNGGGFVFDCRGLANPGRYDEYKQLTGLDKPVIDFLESKSEVADFLEKAKSLVARNVKCYLERGFTDMMVSFGCTGGRHRSVYSAQHMAEWINQTYGVEVELNHIEQNIHSIYPAK